MPWLMQWPAVMTTLGAISVPVQSAYPSGAIAPAVSFHLPVGACRPPTTSGALGGGGGGRRRVPGGGGAGGGAVWSPVLADTEAGTTDRLSRMAHVRICARWSHVRGVC